MTALQAHLAAWVDFPEEDVPELSQSHLCEVLGGVEQELDALIQSYDGRRNVFVSTEKCLLPSGKSMRCSTW